MALGPKLEATASRAVAWAHTVEAAQLLLPLHTLPRSALPLPPSECTSQKLACRDTHNFCLARLRAAGLGSALHLPALHLPVREHSYHGSVHCGRVEADGRHLHTGQP